jgi:uncharacterized protein (TIRG00374 family)
MAKLLTPRVLRRGFELFVLASLVGLGALLLYGRNFDALVAAVPRIHWGWVLAGLGLASMDWLGGGARLWVLARELHLRPSFRGMVLAGGMGAWAAYLTPLMSGNAPMTVYTMRRFGVPVPQAFTLLLMTFLATTAFFGIAGPVAIFFGAGRSLGEHGIVLGISLYDLFLASLGIFVVGFTLLVLTVVWPRGPHLLVRAIGRFLGKRSRRVMKRLDQFEAGIDQAHESMRRFNTPRGWFAILIATIISGPSHANKLLAGYVALRAIGVEAPFTDVLLLQTLISFLLYFFAPTPGGSGVAELLSAAVMSIYVPRPLTALYTMIWRLTTTYFTVGAGSAIFAAWVRRGLKGIEQEPQLVADAQPG